MQLSRRSILAGASLAATPIPAWARAFSPGAFTHGVASGDPRSSSVILWTRFAPAEGASDGHIGWEISESENFRVPTRSGTFTVTPATDWCAKIEASGLRPGRHYFYRFLSASGPSVTGMTRTAPSGNVDSLSVAFFSCSNMPFGYFHAYADAAARDDIDLCLHLGDYIYEYQRGIYPGGSDIVPGRVIEPITEIVSLSDYNARYASYHLDPDLQELRRRKPISVVWDDHELANDTWKGGAQNHQPQTEGNFTDRIAAATKAYYDWMPIRPPMRNGPSIVRTLDWGHLARIVFLDTRFVGRDQQLDYARDLAPQLAGPNPAAAIEAFRTRLNADDRQLLGANQERFLVQALAESKSRGQPWQVIAQQIVVADQTAPQGISRLLPPTAGGNNYFATAERAAQAGLPWNLDAWAGYPAARRRFLEACSLQAANALVLGCDSHNTWVNNLSNAGQNRVAALEFAGGSVSSPGFERSLTNAQPGERETMMKSANPQLAFADLTNRGYGAFTLTRDGCAAEWRAVTDIRVQQRGAATVSRFSASASQRGGPSAWAVSA
jgi:alkaline phosphatase D